MRRRLDRPPTGLPRQIVGLLEELGLDHRQGHNGRRKPNGGCRDGFWLRNEGRLHFILADAKAAHRRAIKAAHPDRAGGNTRQAAHLNRVWTRIQTLFRRKGITL